MKLFDVYPLNDITITKAQGSYVWDENGVQYLDLYGGHAVISIGHTHPHWVKRIDRLRRRLSTWRRGQCRAPASAGKRKLR